jgi:two-component system cell cycle sensor histidine kinase/response regulator CckA
LHHNTGCAVKSPKGRSDTPARKRGLSQAGSKKTEKASGKSTPRYAAIALSEANKALRKSESTLRSIFQASTVGILIVTPDRKISWMNDRITLITGYTLKEIQDRGPRIFYATDDEFARVGRLIFEEVAQGRPMETDLKWVRKDGAMRDIHLSAARIDPNDITLGQVSIITDVTAQKAAEKKLIESEERYRTAIEHSNDSVALIRENKLVYVNQKFLEIFGYDMPEEVIGRSPAIVMHPDDRPMIHRYRTKREQGDTFPKEYTHRGIKKDGTIIFIEVSIAETMYRGEPVAFIYQKDVTERKRTEEALRESENKFRDLAEKAVVGIYIIQDKVFKYVNARCAQIHGYEIEELIDKKGPWEMVFPEDVPMVMEGLETRMSGKTNSLHREFRIVTKAQHMRYIETYGTQTIYQGNPATIGTIIDITERKNAEEALRRSEEKYRNIFENAAEGIFQITPEKLLSANPALARIFGFDSPEELMADNVSLEEPYVNQEDRKALIDLIETSGAVEGFEMQLLRKDGKKIWVSVNARVIRNETESAAYYEGTVTDITNRKLVEEALQESEAKYRSVVDHLVVGFYIIQDNRFCFVNRRFCEMSGYSYDEIVDRGIDPFDLVHDEDKEFVTGIMKKRLAGETDYTGSVYKVVRKDGQIIIVKGVSNLMTYNGRPAIAGGAIDITREISLESQLRQAQKMEAVGTLAGGIAHDFNNILTAIIGYGRLLEMKMADTDPLRTYVAHILSSSEKAANLTRNLLTFSRKQIVELKLVNVGQIVKGMERLLKSLLTEDIELKIILSDPDLAIMADMSQIEQILLNLASNANDAMPRGGTLTIETKEVGRDDIFIDGCDCIEPGKYAYISIIDTGIGIDEKTQSKIFEPFFTTKEVGKGTGLGLSIVHGIVNQHHGYITVQSKPQGGTVFNLYFPAMKTVVEEKEPLSPSVEGGTETILIAEDDPQVRSLTAEILDNAGYTVIEAVDGEEAVEKFLEHSDTVALLLLDVVMPRKNGKEAYDEIRKTNPDMRVIFMSGYTGDVIISKGIIEKEYDFIQKPLPPNELLLRVKGVLSR